MLSKKDEGIIKILQSVLRQYPKQKGIYYIQELWLHKGTPICATQLYTLYQTGTIKNFKDNHVGYHYQNDSSAGYLDPELSIQICDSKTIQELKHEVKNLQIKIEEAKDNNDAARYEDLCDEMNELCKYFSQYLTPRNHIRPLSDHRRKISQLISRAVRITLGYIAKIDPETAQYIKEHIIIGISCVWRV